MANIKSAKKRVRQTKRRTLVNRMRVGRIRTLLRQVEEAIAGGDREKATAAFRAAEPAMMSGVGKGVMHRNTAARRLSRLSARIKVLAA
jgi:small subunit ribosomal protein S20